MIVRVDRLNFAVLVEGLMSGTITYGMLLGFPGERSADPGVSSIWKFLEEHFCNDLRVDRLIVPSASQLELLSKIVVFLRSETDYLGPPYPNKQFVVEAMLIVFSIVNVVGAIILGGAVLALLLLIADSLCFIMVHLRVVRMREALDELWRRSVYSLLGLPFSNDKDWEGLGRLL